MHIQTDKSKQILRIPLQRTQEASHTHILIKLKSGVSFYTPLKSGEERTDYAIKNPLTLLDHSYSAASNDCCKNTDTLTFVLPIFGVRNGD